MNTENNLSSSKQLKMYHINYLKANIYSSGINVFAKSYAEAVEKAASIGIKEEDIVYVQRKEFPRTNQ